MHYPFQFFIEFIELGKLKQAKAEFYENADLENYSKADEWIKYIEFDKNQQGYQVTEYFKDYILEHLAVERVKAITAIDLVLFDEKNQKEVVKRIDILFATFSDYQTKADADPEFIKYGINEVYKSLSDYLISKRGRIYSRPYIETAMPIAKLQWMGQLNQLVTLFYDLKNKNTNTGKPFIIEQSKADLVGFIVNNFLDKDGNAISRDSVETGLKPSKPDKRAKADKSFDIRPYTTGD